MPETTSANLLKGGNPNEHMQSDCHRKPERRDGKSTTALNLGVGLHNEGKSVLLIDLDPQASLSLSLGVTRPDELQVSLSTVMQRIMNDLSFDYDFGLIHCEEGIDLMPSSIELSGVETTMMNVMSREFILKTYVDQMRSQYDYILIDCTPSLGILPINAFVAADSIIVPSQPRILSTKGLDLLMQSYHKVQRAINPDLRIDGILFTMVDTRTNNDKFIIDTMRQGIGQKINVFRSMIPASVKVSEANLNCQSIFSYDDKCKVAEAYRNLTREVMEIGERTQDKVRPKRECVR